LAVIDYCKFNTPVTEFAVMSPYRTQGNKIKEVAEEEWPGQQRPESLDKYVGSIEDFISMQFPLILVSACKTINAETEGGLPINSTEICDFILSRCSETIVIFGKEEELSPAWRAAFYDKASEVIER
jgi:hypothetical protein